jgi:hypothetical protein
MTRKAIDGFTTTAIIVNSTMFAFTLFSNFGDLIKFVGFFEFLIDRWNDVLAWVWDYIFRVLRLNVRLTHIERLTATVTILLFVPFYIASIQARWASTRPEIKMSLDNALRVAGAMPGLLFLVMTWNLSNYQMSKVAFWVATIGMYLVVLSTATIARPWRRPSIEYIKAFFSYLVRNAQVQMLVALVVFMLYLISKLAKLAPPLPS